jgi:hypothetical protein
MKISKSVQIGTHIDKRDGLIDLLAFLQGRKAKKKKLVGIANKYVDLGIQLLLYTYIYRQA